MEATIKPYKATFVLDTRGYDQPVDNLIDTIKNVVTSTGAQVDSASNLGRRDFARVTDRRHTGDYYAEISFRGQPGVAKAIQEGFRLEKKVKRIVIENA